MHADDLSNVKVAYKNAHHHQTPQHHVARDVVIDKEPRGPLLDPYRYAPAYLMPPLTVHPEYIEAVAKRRKVHVSDACSDEAVQRESFSHAPEASGFKIMASSARQGGVPAGISVPVPGQTGIFRAILARQYLCGPLQPWVQPGSQFGASTAQHPPHSAMHTGSGVTTQEHQVARNGPNSSNSESASSGGTLSINDHVGSLSTGRDEQGFAAPYTMPSLSMLDGLAHAAATQQGGGVRQ
jgi:hypothetical protein